MNSTNSNNSNNSNNCNNSKSNSKLARRRGVSASPVKDDIMCWKAVLFGPDDSPWEGGTFWLEAGL